MEEHRSSNTLFVSGLSSIVTNEELENVFGEIGPLKRCFVVSGKGVGYVTFAFKEDVESAMSRIKTVKGKKVNIQIAKKKQNAKNRSKSNEEEKFSVNVDNLSSRKVKGWRHTSSLKSQEGRLIIRNLPFKMEKDDIHKEFSKCGVIKDISIPTKPDGKKLGFGFVQYEKNEDALNAIKRLNAKVLFGRPIAVDHAVPQNEYLRIKTEPDFQDSIDSEIEIKQVKKSNIKDETDVGQKEHDNIDDEGFRSWLESSNVEDEDENNSVDIRSDFKNCDDESSESGEESEGEDEEDSEESGEGDSEINEDYDSKTNSADGKNADRSFSDKKKKYKTSDVQEGKTLFVRNLNYSTSSDKLKEVFSQFGELEYATICVNKLTDHSKGSGFVKFKNREDAERCLKLVTDAPKDGGIIIDDFKICLANAISKNDMWKNKQNEKLDKVKCNRNLYLAREGSIRPGTKAAEGVSKQDLIKRTEVELWKRQMLKNLHIFVSKTRLCVRNLPDNVDDERLRKIFLKAAGPKAIITEARVMRHLTATDADGNGLSKGYGFVNFSEHEPAIKALRQINNNPDIFTAHKRPIVEFSLENKSVLRVKRKRQEKSTNNKMSKNTLISKHFENNNGHEEPDDEVTNSFSGTKSDVIKYKKGLPSHIGPKIRHGRVSRNLLRKQKKVQKRSRKIIVREKMRNKGYAQLNSRKGDFSKNTNFDAKQQTKFKSKKKSFKVFK